MPVLVQSVLFVCFFIVALKSASLSRYMGYTSYSIQWQASKWKLGMGGTLLMTSGGGVFFFSTDAGSLLPHVHVVVFLLSPLLVGSYVFLKL